MVESFAKHWVFLRRCIFFVIGGLVSFALNLLPYTLLRKLLNWEHNPAYAVSLTFVTMLMFFWNYRVNFPTPNHWRKCARRYTLVVVIMWLLNFYSVGWIKELMPVSGAIFISGFVVAALKFGIYHFWVFPNRPVDEIVEEGL